MTVVAQGLPSLDAEGRRVGLSRTKGWFKRFRTAMVRQRNRSDRIAHHERTMDRDANRYSEKVTMQDTGEVVHECSEPLSDHKGHGSDKKKS